MRKENTELAFGLVKLSVIHRNANQIVLLVVSSAGIRVLRDHELPLFLRRDDKQCVSTHWNIVAADRNWNIGEQGHRLTARRPDFVVWNFAAERRRLQIEAEALIFDHHLTVRIEIARCSRLRSCTLCDKCCGDKKDRWENQQATNAKHSTPRSGRGRKGCRSSTLRLRSDRCFSIELPTVRCPDLLSCRTHGNGIFHQFLLAFDSSRSSSYSGQPAQEE